MDKITVKGAALLLALLSASFLVGKFIFPRREIRQIPQIVTEWDTVTVLDTAWVTDIREVRDTVTLVRRVTVRDTVETVVTVTDTIIAFPPVWGMRAVNVPLEWGDTMKVLGFELRGEGDRVTSRDWQADIFVAGPLESLLVDSLPPKVTFHPMPDPPCTFWCKRKHEAIGAGIAVAILGSIALIVK